MQTWCMNKDAFDFHCRLLLTVSVKQKNLTKLTKIIKTQKTKDFRYLCELPELNVLFFVEYPDRVLNFNAFYSTV